MPFYNAPLKVKWYADCSANSNSFSQEDCLLLLDVYTCMCIYLHYRVLSAVFTYYFLFGALEYIELHSLTIFRRQTKCTNL